MKDRHVLPLIPEDHSRIAVLKGVGHKPRAMGEIEGNPKGKTAAVQLSFCNSL
jgi:hypothetical protein